MLIVGLFVSFAYGQTKTEVKTADLKKEISDNIAKTYAGYRIDKAFKSDAAGVITFEVSISKGTEKHFLVYDKDGKFVKANDSKKAEVKKTEPAKKEEVKKAEPSKKEEAKKADAVKK